MPLQFDNKISLGHVISMVAMIAACILAYSTLSARQESLLGEMVALKAEAQARESRIRAVEIAQAGQSSDLRSIQIGISEIKAQLDRMTGQPGAR